MKLELKILDERIAGLSYGSEGAAACDLRACRLDGKSLTYKLNLHPGSKVKIGAGFGIHLQDEFCALILPRSGLGTAGVVRIANQTGLIDPDYQGEVIISIENQSNETFEINPLDRIAQMVILPFARPIVELVEEFSKKTARNNGGFGSTGVS